MAAERVEQKQSIAMLTAMLASKQTKEQDTQTEGLYYPSSQQLEQRAAKAKAAATSLSCLTF